MMRRLLFLLPVLIFAVIAGWFLWGLSPERDPSAVPPAMIDKPAPAFDLAALPRLAVPGLATPDLAGRRLAMVNFFASWCVPSRPAHPPLTALLHAPGIPPHDPNNRGQGKSLLIR